MGTKCNSYCGKFSENIMACFVFVWRSSFKSFGNDKVSLFLIRCFKEQSSPSAKIKVKVLIFEIIRKKRQNTSESVDLLHYQQKSKTEVKGIKSEIAIRSGGGDLCTWSCIEEISLISYIIFLKKVCFSWNTNHTQWDSVTQQHRQKR